MTIKSPEEFTSEWIAAEGLSYHPVEISTVPTSVVPIREHFSSDEQLRFFNHMLLALELIASIRVEEDDDARLVSAVGTARSGLGIASDDNDPMCEVLR